MQLQIYKSGTFVSIVGAGSILQAGCFPVFKYALWPGPQTCHNNRVPFPCTRAIQITVPKGQALLIFQPPFTREAGVKSLWPVRMSC